MTVLQTDLHERAEACPPPCVNTTNKQQTFRHQHGKKSSCLIRSAQLASGAGASGSDDKPVRFWEVANDQTGEYRLSLLFVEVNLVDATWGHRPDRCCKPAQHRVSFHASSSQRAT